MYWVAGIPMAIGLALIAWTIVSIARAVMHHSDSFMYSKEEKEEYKGKNKGLWIKSALKLVVAVVLFLSGSFLFYAEPGYIYFIQYPTGGISVISDSGYYITPFATRYPWAKFITIKLSDIDENTSDTQSTEDNSIKGVRFNDAVSATIAVSARFSMPTETERFKQLHMEYRSPKSLIDSTLVPYVYECVRNAMRLLSAQEYVSGRGGVFEEAFRDQLENGLYAMSIKEKGGEVQIRRTEQQASVTKEPVAGEEAEEVNIVVELKKDGDRIISS